MSSHRIKDFESFFINPLPPPQKKSWEKKKHKQQWGLTLPSDQCKLKRIWNYFPPYLRRVTFFFLLPVLSQSMLLTSCNSTRRKNIPGKCFTPDVWTREFISLILWRRDLATTPTGPWVSTFVCQQGCMRATIPKPSLPEMTAFPWVGRWGT